MYPTNLDEFGIKVNTKITNFSMLSDCKFMGIQQKMHKRRTVISRTFLFLPFIRDESRCTISAMKDLFST